MKRLPLYLLIILSLTFTVSAEAPRWFDIIFRHQDNVSFTVRSLPADSIARAEHQFHALSYTDSLHIFTPGGNTFAFALDSMARCEFRKHIPVIYINTDSIVDEITSKTEYLKATFTMSAGAGIDADFDSISPTSVNIRGRGNTTWLMPKKPYRLKFDKKISLCGMKKAKNYALIANYIDPSLMHNPAALAMARGLGLEFTNHTQPVDVMLNGRYCGSYMLTEKIGINAGSVDIDEEKGLLLELDINMDETYCYRTPGFYLPVMIKDPDLDELAASDTTVTAKQLFDNIKNDFNEAERSLLSSDVNAWQQYFDIESFVNYLIVQNACGNWEFTWPRSLYLYRKTPTSKFQFGPAWDFDWTADYYFVRDANLDYFYPMFIDTDGSEFFRQFTRSEAFWDTYRKQWQIYKTQVWPEVKAYITAYADLIETSAFRNGELWHDKRQDLGRYYWESTASYRTAINRYLKWLERRMEYIEQSPSMGLYW